MEIERREVLRQIIKRRRKLVDGTEIFLLFVVVVPMIVPLLGLRYYSEGKKREHCIVINLLVAVSRRENAK